MDRKTRAYYEKALRYQIQSSRYISLALKSLLLEKGISEEFADRFDVSLLHGGEDNVTMDGEYFIQGLDIAQLDEMSKEEIYNLDPSEPHIKLI